MQCSLPCITAVIIRLKFRDVDMFNNYQMAYFHFLAISYSKLNCTFTKTTTFLCQKVVFFVAVCLFSCKTEELLV